MEIYWKGGIKYFYKKREEYWNHRNFWENYKNETIKRIGCRRASEKWTKHSKEFNLIGKIKFQKLLNLDCVRNLEDILLQRWPNNINFLKIILRVYLDVVFGNFKENSYVI